ncbi:MAG: trigger factor [Myxococcales bacterium]|nr:trigger factor [Myxococcales bacterium]
MIPGFEDQLLGMTIGEQKTFELTFPEGVGPSEAQGKPVEWKIDLKEIKRKIRPELDDEFAQDLGDYDSLSQLEDNIRQNLATRQDARSRRALREQVMVKLVERNTVDVPRSMVDRQISIMLEDAERAVKQNPDPKLTEALDKLRVELRPQAEKRVAGMLLLEAVAKQEAIEVSEEELESRISDLAREYRSTPKQIKQQLKANDQLEMLRYNIRQDKALDLLVREARITDVDGDPDGEDDEAALED